ncbi:MAG: cupin domain-containing protein [Oligoflexales bacterium]|nr:cupin domain-containing protein [Oligoflexales bacterium]
MSDIFTRVKRQISPVVEDQMCTYPLNTKLDSRLVLNLKHKGQLALEWNFHGSACFQFQGDLAAQQGLLSYFPETNDPSSLWIDLGLYELYYTEFGKNGEVASHTHPVDLVVFIFSGTIQMLVEGESNKTYHAGEYFFIPCKHNHSFKFGSKGASCLELWKGKDFWV